MIPLALSLFAFVVSSHQLGNRLTLGLDEAIYFEGAERVAMGQVPYRDFFLLTGPGDSWLYGSLFRLVGPSLPAARALLSAEIALLCGAIYWILSHCASRLFSAAAAVLFLAMLLSSPYGLHATHRWDSNSAVMLALAFTAGGLAPRNWKYLSIAGAFAAASAWTTPSLALPSLAIAIWIGLAAGWRKSIWFYLAGGAVPTIPAACFLWSQGALGPMFRHLFWSTANYGGVNWVPYGSMAGSPQLALSGGYGAGRAALELLPVLLPALAYIGWAILFWKRKREVGAANRLILLLLAASAAIVAAAYPRFGGYQLLFVSPVFVVLCSYAIWFALPDPWHKPFATVLMASSIVFVFATAPLRLERRIETRVGELQCSRRHYAMVSTLQQYIKPGDSLFVFPYLPIVYFLTGGQNPTRYSFLQPGMMTAEDEAFVLGDLRKRAPHWIVWHAFSSQLILRNWPNSDPNRLRFPAIEAFINENYHDINAGEAGRVGYRLMERNQDRI